MPTNEPFSRVKIDAQLKDVGWKLTDGRSVRFEYGLPDGTKADYWLAHHVADVRAIIAQQERTGAAAHHLVESLMRSFDT